MTIPSGSSGVSRHVGNGVADTFDYDFKITDQSELLVTTTDTAGVATVLTLTTDYTVTGVGSDTGGQVTLVAGALTSGYDIAIEDNVGASQETPFGNQSAFFGINHENALDKLTRLVRRALERTANSLHLPSNVTGVTTSLGEPVALSVPRMNAAADAFELVPQADIVSDAQSGFRLVKITTTAGQTALDLGSETYTPGINQVFLVANGSTFMPDTGHFTETDTTTITLAHAFPAETVVYVAIGVAKAGSTAQAFNVGYSPSGTGAVDTDVQTVLRSWTVVTLYSTLQEAIDTGKSLYFPDGTHLANNLTATTNYQMFWFSGGAILKKNANGPLLTVSADRTQFLNARLDGDGATYTGHNLVKSGNHMTLINCSSKDAASRAVYDSDGDGLRIIGTNDVYETADATSAGYDIEIAGSGIYSKITDIYTGQATGGIYINVAGTVSLLGSQFGKLFWSGGIGGYLTNCRINGAMNIEAGGVAIGPGSASADVTIGDGSTAFSQITMSPNFTMQSGTTLDITAGVQDSKFHNLDTLRNNGVTVTIGATTDNDYYDGRVSYTPTWTGGSPSIGNGTIVGYYTRRGRTVNLSVSIQFGSTTTFGSGAWAFSLPITASSILARQVGDCLLEDSGGPVFYSAITEIQSGASTCSIKINGAGTVTPTAPFTFASGDRISFNVEYEV